MSLGGKYVCRRLSTGWIVGLSLIAFALPIAVLGLSIPIVVNRRWERMQTECRNQAALGDQDLHRTVLRGEAVSGDAWEDYRGALKLINRVDFPYPAFDCVDHPESVDPETLQIWTERVLPAVEQALSGTRRAECRSPRDGQGLRNLSFWRLTAPGIFRARQLAERGRLQESVELLLDMIRLNGDGARGSSWTSGSSAVWQQVRCITELKTLMAIGILDRVLLRQMGRELELLDSDLPRFGEGMQCHAMEVGFRVLNAESMEGFFKQCEIHDKTVPIWRQGVFGKLTLLNWYETEKLASKKMAEGDLRAWPEARVATREASAELYAGSRFMQELWNNSAAKPDYLPIHRSFRDGLAQLRLLRAATRYLADGTLPDADDPYGGKLRWSKKGHVFRIWSRGVDGIDDGGSGGWNPKAGRDIVLEFRR